MRIALCDDERSELQRIGAMLEELAERGGLVSGALLLRSYTSARELLADLEAGARYDLVFLDILMPGMSGIDAARELREHDQVSDIVFLTSSAEYAVDSYELRATDYLLKPVTRERLAMTLDRVAQRLDQRDESLVLTTPTRLVSLSFSQIEYAEIRGKTLHFMLLGSREEQVTAPLRDYEPQLLAHKGFVKVHRSYIVNMANAKVLDASGFKTLSGRFVPVSRNLKREVREAFLSFLFDDAQGKVC